MYAMSTSNHLPAHSGSASMPSGEWTRGQIQISGAYSAHMQSPNIPLMPRDAHALPIKKCYITASLPSQMPL